MRLAARPYEPVSVNIADKLGGIYAALPAACRPTECIDIQFGWGLQDSDGYFLSFRQVDFFQGFQKTSPDSRTNGSAHLFPSFSFGAHRRFHIDLNIGGTLHSSTVRNVEDGNLNPRNSAKPFSNVDDFVDTQSIQHQSSAIAFNRPATTLSTTIGYDSSKFNRFQYVPKSDSGPGGRRFKSSGPDYKNQLVKAGPKGPPFLMSTRMSTRTRFGRASRDSTTLRLTVARDGLPPFPTNA